MKTPKYGSNVAKIAENGRLFAGTSHPTEWNWKPRTARATARREAFREAIQDALDASDRNRAARIALAEYLGIEDL